MCPWLPLAPRSPPAYASAALCKPCVRAHVSGQGFGPPYAPAPLRNLLWHSQYFRAPSTEGTGIPNRCPATRTLPRFQRRDPQLRRGLRTVRPPPPPQATKSRDPRTTDAIARSMSTKVLRRLSPLQGPWTLGTVEVLHLQRTEVDAATAVGPDSRLELDDPPAGQEGGVA